MILLVKRNNIILVGLIALLLVAVYSLNFSPEQSQEVTNNGDFAGKTIVLDPGHGGEDPGAVSDYSGLREKEVNLEIALKAKEQLEKEGFKVILTRSEDRLEYVEGTTNIIQKRKQDLIRRKQIMDEPGVNAVISIHLNKFPETQYYGAQAFYPHHSPPSQKLAVSIQNAVKELVDPENKRNALVRGKANELPIMIMRDLKNPTAVLECGFLSNQEEESKLATAEYRQRLAAAIVLGVKNNFK